MYFVRMSYLETMSNRKELKKSLGLSEYPWSSDEDEPLSFDGISSNLPTRESQNQPVTDTQENVYRHQPAPSLESSQPSMPSTLQQSRRAEARRDRDTYWGLLNNPSVPPLNFESQSPRTQEISFPSSSRSVIHVPPAELREDAISSGINDVRKFLALKKLSAKALLYMRQRQANPGLHPSRGHASTSRGAVLPQPGPSCHRQNSQKDRLRRTQSDYVSYMKAYNVILPRTNSSRESVLASSSGYSGNHRSAAPAEVHGRNEDIIINDDPAELEPTDDAETPNVPSREEVEFEDIIEVDVETDTSPTGQSTSNVQNNVESEQNHSEEIINVENSPRRGVKRKRHGSEETNDADAFNELNRTLLRLLECPVCLEWAEPPISQCRRGHLVCNSCRTRIVSCPVCRTAFSSVRNRAMEGVSEVLRYPCRHGCGREVRLRRRGPHEASCPARRYLCPAPACEHRTALMPHSQLLPHFQQEHPAILLAGTKHQLSVRMNSDQHEHWFISAHQEVFHARIDVDVRSWGLVIHVSYIGPKTRSRRFVYQISVLGQHHERQTTYSRTTHYHLDGHYLAISKQDCFHLTLDQALNFLRRKNKNNEASQSRRLEFFIEIKKSEMEEIRDDESD